MLTYMWTAWQGIAQARIEGKDYPGIYQVRIVDEAVIPLPIHRITGIDEEGIIYIGSGDVNERIKELQRALNVKGHHNGGSTYILMRQNFRYMGPIYANCKPQYRVMLFPSADKVECERQEAIMLADYFSKYSELPPCNSSFPDKWGEFSKRLQQLWERNTKP